MRNLKRAKIKNIKEKHMQNIVKPSWSVRAATNPIKKEAKKITRELKGLLKKFLIINHDPEAIYTKMYPPIRRKIAQKPTLNRPD
jgi:hypothetical protein